MFAASYPQADAVLLIFIFDLTIHAGSLSHQAAEKKKKSGMSLTCFSRTTQYGFLPLSFDVWADGAFWHRLRTGFENRFGNCNIALSCDFDI